MKLVAIAKGPDRDAGREWFHTDGVAPFQLPPRDPVLYFLQRLRDEAHRFAITTHRAGRSKNIRQSELDEIPGIGAARKRALLNHFGSARGVKMAGLADLEAAPGHQPRDRAAGVRAFPSGGADGGCFVARRQIAKASHHSLQVGGPSASQPYCLCANGRAFGAVLADPNGHPRPAPRRCARRRRLSTVRRNSSADAIDPLTIATLMAFTLRIIAGAACSAAQVAGP